MAPTDGWPRSDIFLPVADAVRSACHGWFLLIWLMPATATDTHCRVFCCFLHVHADSRVLLGLLSSTPSGGRDVAVVLQLTRFACTKQRLLRPRHVRPLTSRHRSCEDARMNDHEGGV
eukprot:6184466-Pleurochrysis_carterae.AAC.3